MKVPFASFEPMHQEIQDKVLQKMEEVYKNNWFIRGKEVEKFEMTLQISVERNIA